MFSLAPLVVFFPLAGFVVNAFWGRRLGAERSGWLAVTAAFAAFVVAVLLALALAGNGYAPVTVPVADWIVVGDLRVPWAFQVDTLSVTMMLVVSGVGALIHLYSLGYMRGDVEHNGDPARYPRFFVYLNLFLAAMLVLVGANNFLMMFVGWEGVGLCSYLLIGFWFEKGAGQIGNARAAMKAFVVNRIGDFGLMLAMFLIFWTFGSLTFADVFGRLETIRLDTTGQLIVTAITLLLLLGATGKSAQIPLYVWLPDAMAGPTPVSALIHAATMVTAGIYLITRTQALFALAPFSQAVVAWIGAATALFAATIAVGQTDIKRVLAYSTISQLGFMVTAVGLGAYSAGMFHLVTHAFFKALLFLSAGSVIQAVERGAHHGGGDEHLDAQDMRNMGGLWGRLPVTQWVFLIGGLALAGLPPLSGFFSKDEILLDAFERNFPIYVVLSAAALLTAFYVGRQILMVFFGKARTAAAGAATESAPVITTPLIILAVLSILGGALNLPGAQAFTAWLGHTLGEAESTPFSWTVAGISAGLAVVGLILAYALYARAYPTAEAHDPVPSPLFDALRDKWYIDELYGFLFVRPFNTLANVLAQAFDLGGIDMTANNLGDLARAVGDGLSRFQLGYARRYALVMFVGVVAVLAYFLLVR